MDILRISTAGSVDDGKSTLIGRLLYDTGSLAKDKIEAIRRSSEKKGLELDLSLFTDGLVAEREQGITIDVAHIYFNTNKRKYIIADTPGHVEYTRNMVTGASTSQVSIILIDARNGVSEQTKRHFYITTLLRIPEVVVCVNKMDLVDYSEERFYAIASEFQQLAEKHTFEGQKVSFIPVSALKGDNIVEKSDVMKWYTGVSLMQHLETLKATPESNKPARFPVQYVIRPQEDKYHDYRGYAGKVASGTLNVGDNIVALPSGHRSAIKSITRYEGIQNEAKAGESVTLLLEDDIDISRGDLIVRENEQPELRSAFETTLCWMGSQPLNQSKKYLLQHGPNRTFAKVANIYSVLDPNTLTDEVPVGQISLNTIARLSIKTASPLYADSFADNKGNGAFILIDEQSNNTVAVGFVN